MGNFDSFCDILWGDSYGDPGDGDNWDNGEFVEWIPNLRYFGCTVSLLSLVLVCLVFWQSLLNKFDYSILLFDWFTVFGSNVWKELSCFSNRLLCPFFCLMLVWHTGEASVDPYLFFSSFLPKISSILSCKLYIYLKFFISAIFFSWILYSLASPLSYFIVSRNIRHEYLY